MNCNPEIPYNEIPLLPPKSDLDDVAILKKVNTANIALARLNGALREVTNQEAWKPWIVFVLTAIERQAVNAARTIDEILILQRNIDLVIRGIKPALPYQELILYLFSNP